MAHASSITTEGTQLIVLGGDVTEGEAAALRTTLVAAMVRTRPPRLIMELLPGVVMDDTVVGALRAAKGIAADLGIDVECRCADSALRARLFGPAPDLD